jgi:nucleoside-diphosphate-sugar epimerase
VHGWTKFAESCELDKHAIETIGAVLENSSRPFIVTSGIGVALGPAATDDDPPLTPSNTYPRASEATAVALMERGVRASVMRLRHVHDTEKQGLITPLIAVARAKGVSAYVGNGHNRWPAVHIVVAARLYRLALEKGTAGARYHAIAEERVPLKDIANAIGRGLNVPVISISQEQAKDYFAFFALSAGTDSLASSARNRNSWANNRTDFLALYRRTTLHAGLVIIVPNIKPALQRQLFEAVLHLIGDRDLVNTVIEVGYSDEKIECRQYALPPG